MDREEDNDTFDGVFTELVRVSLPQGFVVVERERRRVGTMPWRVEMEAEAWRERFFVSSLPWPEENL